MPAITTLGGFFTDEWERFEKGVRLLNPDAAEAELRKQKSLALTPGAPRTINIPGWDDVVHIRPRYQPTEAERSEYWTARADKRKPNLPGAVVGELDRRRHQTAASRTSAAPGWNQGFSGVLTAIDNVQDFASTISTLGRLALWGGSRIGLRMIPGLGTAILISDALNTLSLLGMMANVAYAFLCAGPKEALAAGVPMLLFKRALQGEAWRWLRSNPFGRAARLRRASKALGELPGLSNLFEVAQTTDQLFGRGLSFGGLVGALVESANGAALASQGSTITVDTTQLQRSFGATINTPLVERSPAELLLARQAGRVLTAAPLLFLRAEDFSDDDVRLHLTAYAVAFDVVSRQLRGHQWQEAAAAAFREPIRPPFALDGFTRDALAAEGINPDDGRAWAIEGSPAALSSDDYVRQVGNPAGDALGRWLLARRNTDLAQYPGALMSSVAELFTATLDDDPELAQWELTADSRVIHSLAEEGLLPALGGPPEALWNFWKACRAILEARPHQTLVARQLRELAAAHGVTLISSLPPDAPLPFEWRAPLGLP